MSLKTKTFHFYKKNAEYNVINSKIKYTIDLKNGKHIQKVIITGLLEIWTKLVR